MFVFASTKFKLHVNAIYFLKHLGTLIEGLVLPSAEFTDDLKYLIEFGKYLFQVSFRMDWVVRKVSYCIFSYLVGALMYFLLIVCSPFSVLELLILLQSARKLDIKFVIESMARWFIISSMYNLYVLLLSVLKLDRIHYVQQHY